MLQQQLIERSKHQGNKHRLFRLFYTLLKHYQVHVNLYYVLLVIEILQMVHFGCHPSFEKLWPSPITDVIQAVLGFTDLSGLWVLAGGPALIIFTSLSLLFNIFTTGIILYEMLKDPAKLQQSNLFIIKFLTYYFVFLRIVLIIPMVLAFTCFASPSLYGLDSTSQIVLGVISILGFVFLMGNAILGILLFRNNSPFSKVEFSSSVNFLDELRLGTKVVLGVYGSMAQKGTTVPLIFGIIYLIPLLISIYFMRSRSGLTIYPFNRIYELGIILPLWTIFASLAQVIASPTESVGLYLWAVGLMVIPFAWGHLQTRIQIQLLTTHFKSLTTSNQYLSYNYSCIRMANHREDPSNLTMLQGILSIHIQNCKKPADLCVCTKVRMGLMGRSFDQTREEQDQQTVLWFQFIRNNLLEVSSKYDTSPQIFFLLAYIENDVLSNKFRSLHSLQQGMSLPGGIKFQLLGYNQLRRVQQKMSSEDKVKNEKKAVDINRFFTFQMDFSKLQEMIQQATYQYIAFWQLLKSQKVTRQYLYNQGSIIIKDLDGIKEKYSKLIHLNGSNIHCLILYANFMKVIANSNQSYERVQEVIEGAKRSITQNYKISSDVEKQKYGENSVSAVVIISGERKSIGIIKHSNSKVADIVGYTPHQLLGQNINTIMPKFIGNMHDDVLRNYLQLSQSQKDYVERIVPMMDINNFMVIGRVLSKPFPNLLNGLELIGIFNSVVDISPNHPGERPKYVLYRSDTGQVQALSQSCYSQFRYKINKIDQYHETSSELTFKSFFSGLKQADIIDGHKVKCKAISKCHNSSDYEEVPVEVYQRLLIYYYSVNLRLLCFYSLRNFRDIEPAREVIPDGMESSMFKETEINKITGLGLTNNNKKVKQRFLHEAGKKDSVVVTEPTQLKILKFWGFGFLITLFVLAIVYLVLNMKLDHFQDYFKLTKSNGEVVGNICETAFNSRLKQMTNFYPADLPPYADINSNLSMAVNSVQQDQIDVDKIYLKYSDFNSLSTRQYTYGATKVVSFGLINLNSHIFDYVTVSASMKSLPQFTLNYPLQIFTVPVVGAPTTILFKCRYNSLFQILPAQKQFISTYTSIFNSRFEQEQKRLVIEFTIAVILNVVIFIVAICLAVRIIKKTDETMLLFGHVTRYQVQKQIDNCNIFLDIFYQDSYMIKLRQRQKDKDSIGANQFAIEQEHLKKSQLNLPVDDKNMSQVSNISYQNAAKLSMNKIQFLQKELQLRTEGDIVMSQGQNQVDNQNQMLRIQGSSSDQSSIYDKLQMQTDGCKCKIITVYILLMCLIISYFLTQYLTNTQFKTQIQHSVEHYSVIYSNLNSLKQIKLYALETYIDNTQFMNQPLLSVMFAGVYQDLYANQREFDRLNLEYQGSYPFIYNYRNICDPNILSTLASSSNLKYYSSAAFSSTQCSTLLQSMLTEGLRLSIVGYAESLLNISTQNIQVNNFSTTNFKNLITVQKYLEAPFRQFLFSHEGQITTLIDERQFLMVISLVIFCVLLLLVFFCVWMKSLNKLLERLKTTRNILGFIPVHVFMHNAKLTKEYETYIGELMN